MHARWEPPKPVVQHALSRLHYMGSGVYDQIHRWLVSIRRTRDALEPLWRDGGGGAKVLEMAAAEHDKIMTQYNQNVERRMNAYYRERVREQAQRNFPQEVTRGRTEWITD